MKKTLQSYKSKVKPVWCPGCGYYAVQNALLKAFLELNIEPCNILMVSGIGCSGRFSHYFNTYSLNGTHGRAIPIAIGAHAVRPELTVVAVSGDGDGLGIGGGHIPHAARKNPDITYLLLDNNIYGLTKGQTSPTTPRHNKTKTSPYGVFEEKLQAVPIFLSYDISFVARTSCFHQQEMKEVLVSALQHKGMSVVYILNQCVTFGQMSRDDFLSALTPLPADYRPDNKIQALELAYRENPAYSGIFYRVEKPTLYENLRTEIKKACSQSSSSKRKLKPEELIKRFI